MNNYKILFGLRILKAILTSFVDSFFVLYFMEVSNNNILPLGIYKLIAISAIYAVIFLCRNINKSKNRVMLLRIGIILDFIYFLVIILLKEQIVKYMYLIGILYGLEEGFYFSVYHILESDGINNEERAKFSGSYTAVQSILSIIFPLIFGSIIYSIGFIKCLLIVLLIVISRIILSVLFKDTNIPKNNKTNMKEFKKIAKNNKKITQMAKVEFFSGLTYSEGAFSYIVTIYIIKIFSSSFSLGIFTSIFNIITCLLGILFAKCIKPNHYKNVIKISMIFTVCSLSLMIYNCTMITVVLFNLFQTFSKNLMTLINGNSQANISNIDILKNEFKVEYWLFNETALFIGRCISNTLFILMAFTNSNIITYSFVIFLILFAKNSIKLQTIIKENN